MLSLISRDDVETDPQKWSDVLLKMQSLKECSDRHYAKLLVVIVNEELKDLPAELISTFRVRFGLEEKCLLTLLAINVDPSDPSVVQLANNDLKSIGHLILESTWAVHQEHANRIQLRATQKLNSTPQTKVQDFCKLGFLAEFQQDWTGAVSSYSSAYRYLLELLMKEKVKHPVLLESLYVSDFLTMKICLLLMHQQRSEEAWKHFHLHISNFRIPSGVLRVGLRSFFLGWLSRQYQVITDIVQQRTGTHQALMSVSVVSRRHLANLYFYAAEAALQQRRHSEATVNQLSAGELQMYDFVVPSRYWGQFKLKSDDSYKVVPEDILDEYLLAAESNKPLKRRAIDLLQKCLVQLKQSKIPRKTAHVTALLAEEQLAAGEVHAARENLLNVADIYRRDGWYFPLSKALRLLIEISSESSWENAIYSLELATLEDAASVSERSTFAQLGIQSLLVERSEKSQSKLWESDSTDSDLLPRRAKVKGDFRDIGWSSIVEILCGFEANVGFNQKIHFGVALKNNLPISLPVHSLSVHFLEHKGHPRAIKFEDADSIDLNPGEWKSFTTNFVPAVPGEMRAEFIEIQFGPQASLAWHTRLSSKPNAEQENSEEDHLERLPFKDSIVSIGLHAIRIKHVTGPKDVYLGEKIGVKIQIECEAEFHGEFLRLDLSCDNSMGEPQWDDSELASTESRDIKVEPGADWSRSYFMTVRSFGVVSVRATLRLNSEASITQCLTFEVKEPFHVDSVIMSPPCTYLMLPAEDNDFQKQDERDVEDICIPEGREVYVKLALRCKADCQLTLLEISYLTSDGSDLKVTEVSNSTGIQVQKDDVHFKIFKVELSCPPKKDCVSSLCLRWKRTRESILSQISGSLEQDLRRESAEGHRVEEAETVHKLHKITSAKPLLSARWIPPAEVQTGVDFPLILVLSNHTALPEEFLVVMAESQGCLFSGDRSNQLVIAPRGESRISWKCVVNTSGAIKLPKITVSSSRINCSVELEDREIFSRPSSGRLF